MSHEIHPVYIGRESPKVLCCGLIPLRESLVLSSSTNLAAPLQINTHCKVIRQQEINFFSSWRIQVELNILSTPMRNSTANLTGVTYINMAAEWVKDGGRKEGVRAAGGFLG